MILFVDVDNGDGKSGGNNNSSLSISDNNPTLDIEWLYSWLMLRGCCCEFELFGRFGKTVVEGGVVKGVTLYGVELIEAGNDGGGGDAKLWWLLLLISIILLFILLFKELLFVFVWDGDCNSAGNDGGKSDIEVFNSFVLVFVFVDTNPVPSFASKFAITTDNCFWCCCW